MLEQQYGWPIYEADKRVKELKIIIGNAYKNPFSTIQSIFHQFCKAIQSENMEQINNELYQNIYRKRHITSEEYYYILLM